MLCHISLDMKKAFDRLWRDGLFFKLIDKIEQPYWRALYNYYKKSKGRVKIDGDFSNEFEIKEGAKQGGILSPYLFNYFINDLLNEIDELNLDASIGTYKVGLISYCNDLIIISPLVSHANKIIKLCEKFASKWKQFLTLKNATGIFTDRHLDAIKSASCICICIIDADA